LPAKPGGGSVIASKLPRRVFIRDLEIMASIGVFEVEHRYEQRIVVSVDLDVVDTYDGSERLSDVVDYSQVVARIEAIAHAGHVKLIETLAEKFAQTCLDDSRVLSVRVRIEKPDIMPNCRSVGIEIERRRG
jgi:7,8-dihydroneopterin aldolase/epimerase/oxygenase